MDITIVTILNNPKTKIDSKFLSFFIFVTDNSEKPINLHYIKAII